MIWRRQFASPGSRDNVKKPLALLALLVFSACGGVPGPDDISESQRAVVTRVFSSPYGLGASVDVYVGYWTFTGYPSVLFKRWSDGACTGYVIDGDFSLTVNAQVYLSNSADRATVVSGGAPTTQVYCNSGTMVGWTTFFTMAQDPSRWVDVYGMGGNDTLLCNGPSTSGNACHGDGGNDFMKTSTGNVTLYGWDGDDKLISDVRGGLLTMYGMSGNDCLQVPAGSGAPALTYDCGSDTAGDYAVGSGSTNCEAVTSTCYGD